MSVTDWLEAAQARCDAASPGPWRKISHWQFGYDEAGETYSLAGFDDHPTEEDEAFMLRARTDLPRALAALRAVAELMDLWTMSAEARGIQGHALAVSADTVRITMSNALKDAS